MNSMRPWNRQTVPLRLDGGAGQRANLSEAPSGVLTTPDTAPSGTGLAGMETSFIGGYFRGLALPGARAAPHARNRAGRRWRIMRAGRPRSQVAFRAYLNRITESSAALTTNVREARLQKPGHVQPLKPPASSLCCGGCRPFGCTNTVRPFGGPLHVASKEDMPCVHTTFPRSTAPP